MNPSEKTDQTSSCRRSPFRAVWRREWKRMTSRRLYFGVSVVLPLFILFFMATIFGNGQMENIPIGIVDQDQTATSRSIARRMQAVPTFKVTRSFVNETEARKAVQQKEIYGYLSIPSQFEENAVAGKTATLSYYYHYALLAVGSELMAAFESSLVEVSLSPIVLQAVALGVTPQQISTFLFPVQASTHPIYNPSLDYSIYLSQPFYFVLLQILVLLTTVYAIGIEVKRHTALQWLATAHDDIAIAVGGKLAPYSLLFILMALLGNYVFFGIEHIPFHGNWLELSIMSILFILSTQALALFLYSLFPALAYVISVVSMIGSLGATLSGITFPVADMYPIVRAASYLFPVRHFTEIIQTLLYDGGSSSALNQAFGSRFLYYWPSAVALCLFPLLACCLLPRLKRLLMKKKSFPIGRMTHFKLKMTQFLHRPFRPTDKNHAEKGSLAAVIRHEYLTLSTHPAILLVLMGGIFMYGLLYNYMYAPNKVTHMPVAVVDRSHSSLSRQYTRWLNATPQISVYQIATDYHEAEEWMHQGQVEGIIYLPHDFEERVYRGEESVFAQYATTAAFLSFEALQEASSRVMLALNDHCRQDALTSLPPQGLLAVSTAQPVQVVGTALYNFTEGYGSYLIPAVMMIILFQTLLMVIGMATGEESFNGLVSKCKDLLSSKNSVVVRKYITFSRKSEETKGNCDLVENKVRIDFWETETDKEIAGENSEKKMAAQVADDFYEEVIDGENSEKKMAAQTADDFYEEEIADENSEKKMAAQTADDFYEEEIDDENSEKKMAAQTADDFYEEEIAGENSEKKNEWKEACRLVGGKTFVYCSLYAVFSLFLLGLLPHFFSIPNIGNGLYITLMMIPYLLATSFLGLTASRYFTDSEAPLLLIAFFSVGLIFLSGISYPLELMPPYWRVVHYLLPAAPGTLAFVKLNSMGGTMADIRPEFITLWVQTLVYFITSVLVYRSKIRRYRTS